MNYKIAISIFVLLSLSWAAASIEPLNLGSGVGGQVINLDAGARQPSGNYNHNFGRSGFVTPTMPQSKALSPNAMITQAESLVKEARVARDEAVSARIESRANYNESQSLLSKINDKERSIESLLKNAEASANASAKSAVQAGNYSNQTQLIYNQMISVFNESTALYDNMILLAEEVRDNEGKNRTYTNQSNA